MTIRGHSTAGFTLIEMLAVVAILAILMTIGIGAVEMLIPDSELVAAARELASFIEDARDEAVISGRAVHLEFELGDHRDDFQRYRSILEPEPGREDEKEEDEFMLTLRNWAIFPESIQLEKIAFSAEDEIDSGEYKITIYPDGTLKGHVLVLYSPELDAFASIQVSGLLGTAQFSLGEVEPQELTEDTF